MGNIPKSNYDEAQKSEALAEFMQSLSDNMDSIESTLHKMVDAGLLDDKHGETIYNIYIKAFNDSLDYAHNVLGDVMAKIEAEIKEELKSNDQTYKH